MNHPLLDQLNSSIGDLVRGESVEFGGEWTKSSRQAYTSEAQIGSGSGPFVEGADFRWRGTLTSASPFSGIAFLLTADNLYWAKAQEVSLTLPVDVSLHAYAGHTAEGATFTARLGVPSSLAPLWLAARTWRERALLDRTSSSRAVSPALLDRARPTSSCCSYRVAF